MPFTLAHPAAVLPLARTLPLRALIAGSLAPDLVYYLPLGIDGTRTHSLAGILAPDLLLGLALLAAYRLVEPPLRALANPRFSRRDPAPRSPLWIPIALAVGTVTHIVWDSFTHTDGYAVQHFTWLQTAVIEPHKLYNVLGYISSIGGLAILILSARAHSRRSTRHHLPEPARRPATTAVAVALTLSALAGTALALTDPIIHASGYDFVRQALLGAMKGAAIALLLYVAGWWIATACPRIRGPRESGLGPRESHE